MEGLLDGVLLTLLVRADTDLAADVQVRKRVRSSMVRVIEWAGSVIQWAGFIHTGAGLGPGIGPWPFERPRPRIRPQDPWQISQRDMLPI